MAAATAVTFNDFEGHLPVARLFKCNPSNTCTAFYMISTDSVVARFLCVSRASCSSLISSAMEAAKETKFGTKVA